jgi:tRNA A37 threonylcarbamoyladenosine dehydratase
MTAKIELVCRASELNVPIICSMGAANKLDPTAFEVADIYETAVCPMARIMRKELRARGVEALKVVYSKETPCSGNHLPSVDGTLFSKRARSRPLPSSISFVPPVVGLILAGVVIKGLIS